MKNNFKKIIGFYRKCDLLTMLGTTFSLIGIFLVLNMHYTLASLCLILSGICDAFDGTLARKHQYTKQQQVYGGELDSLSDAICFGLLPAIITAAVSPFLITKIICCFYMLCGIVRLAYFNTLSITDATKKGKFIGVPITTSSIVLPLTFIITRFINYSYLSTVLPIVLFVLGIAFIVRIEFKKPNVANIFKKIFNKYVINYVLFPIFIVVFSDLFFKLNSYTLLESIKAAIHTITSHFLPFIGMVAIVDVLLFTLNCIFKKSNISRLIILILITILLVISDIKFNIMGIPLELFDVNYLNPDNMTMMGTATGSIGKWIIDIIIKALVMLIIGILFMVLDRKQQVIIEKKIQRIIFSISGVILISIFVVLTLKTNNNILKNVYKTNSAELSTYNSAYEIYNEYGFWQGLYVNSLYANDNAPEGYDKKETFNLLKDYESYDSQNNWGKANVVFILSEAFSDLGNIDEIKFDKSLTSNIDSYADDENKAVLDLLVSVYGGVSVNTEFEILTGASFSFWRPGFIAYTQYYNKANGKLAPNLIKEFNNNGYETIYLTPWGDTSYKSKFVYDSFGTDKTIYGKDLTGENKGPYYSDKSLMEDIYNELKDTSNGHYKFIMAATGQNHFPYNGEIYDEYDIEVVETSYNEEDSQILKNYAQGVYDADKELNNLYEMIKDLDVPTIIVFYGDHLPYTLNSNGVDPYTSSSYFNTTNDSLNYLRKYTTKAVILSNYDISIDNLDYINASYLGAYVLNQMDLEISNYFKFVDSARTVIPVFNRSVIYQNEHTYDYTNASEEIINMINNYKYVQYGSFYDFIS